MAKTCPSCGYSPIGPFTDNCPICAEPVRNVRSGGRRGGGGGMAPVVRWLLIAGVAFVLGVAGCCGLGMWQMNRAVKDAQQAMEEEQKRMEEERKARTVVVPAAQLLKEFQDDPAAADLKYKGKYLEVSGVVERAGRQGGHTPFVVLHGGDEQSKVKIECFFFPEDDEDEAKIARLGKGQAVTVRGEYDGRVSNVQLRDCVLGK